MRKLIDIIHKNQNVLNVIKHEHFCEEGGTKATHCSSCAKIVSEKENIVMIYLNANKCIECILLGQVFV